MLNIVRPAALITAILGLTLPNLAQAYIGPGAGLGAIAVTIALVCGVLLLLVGVVWYPLKRYFKDKKSGTKGGPSNGAQ
ncbi:hypothetical protein [Zhongshania sp.]|jgi:TM2 domain-containing membrane protein YozV|uniref:hypothetical protein n=1 Tax=Zhongshania sp. TaxID=1971902 RepID=UPI0039E2B470